MKRVLFLLLILIQSIISAQNEAAIWYFGQNAGLDFNTGVPVVLTDGQLDTFEGCATISDSSGNLLFYTDGVTVWDYSHSIMPNGTGLLGDESSTQSAIIVPKPNDPNQYYIFTVDQRVQVLNSSNGINYSTVDLTLNSGLGDVISSEKNINVIGSAYENISAVIHSNNNSYWVISYIGNRFYAWLVDATGVNTTPITSTVSNSSATRGYLKISPDGTKIASANYGSSGYSLMLYDFDDATGIASNETQLTFDDTADIPYGVEFSAQSQKLYVTTSQEISSSELSDPAKLYQFDMLSASIPTSRVLIHTSSNNTRGAVQLAIDGKIYRALSNSRTSQVGTNYLGIINDPEADGLACNYAHDALDISAGNPNRRVVEGLPPFIQSFFRVNINANNVCFGETTEFSISSTTTPDSIVWDFGDPSSGTDNTSTLENPTHIFTSSGTFTITATVTVGLEVEVITIEITIYDLPVVTTPVTLIQCDDDLDGFVDFNLEEANTLISSETPAPTITYFETEADAIANTNVIATPTAFSNSIVSTVWARVENDAGCFVTAEVILQVTSTQIPSDLMIEFYECDDDDDGFVNFNFSSATTQIETALLPTTNLSVSYYETIADGLAETNAIDSTNYTNTTATTQQIVVRVDDLNNGCFGLGFHVTLNVKPIPQFDLLTTVEFCENDAIKVIRVENSTDTYSYQWVDSANTILSTADSLSVSLSDTYTVTATSLNTDGGISCETSASIDVTINPIPIITTPVTLIQCDDDLDGIVDFNLEEASTIVSSETPTPTITYFETEADALANTNSITNPTTFSNSTTSTVWARVENSFGCFVTAQVNLELAATNIPSDLMITFNECDDDLIDNDDTNGIKTFDFSTATSQILDALLPETNLTVSYYETIIDALAETNEIDPTNYRNTTAFSQQIAVRVDDLNNGCFGIGYYVTLNVEALPTFDLLDEITLCLTSSLSLISVENPLTNYLYEWRNEDNEIVGTTQEISVDESGIYTVTVENIDGFSCNKSQAIEVFAQTITDLTEFSESNIEIESTNLNNTITVLTNNLPTGNFEFALDDGMYQSENIFTFVLGGEHTIHINDLENCTYANTTIQLISVPNFFTPNFDGYNDTWQVSGVEFQPSSKIYIFDRFGKLVKILSPLSDGWDGSYKGNPLPSTDYWYKIELEDGRTLKGHFSLIRR